LPTGNEGEAISAVGAFLEGTGFEPIWLREALGLGVFGELFFAHKVQHDQFLRKTSLGISLIPVMLLHRQRMDLQDPSQGRGARPAEGTGHLGAETGGHMLREQT